MKFKHKKMHNATLSEKIADALTIKPRLDIEDDQVFNTKPKTLSRAEFSSSDSEDDPIISEFKKRNVNLLSEISKKYEGRVVSSKNDSNDNESDDSIEEIRKSGFQSKDLKHPNQVNDSDKSNSDGSDCDDFSIVKTQEQISSSDEEKSDESVGDGEDSEESEKDEEGYDISEMQEPMNENFKHIRKQNISEEAKKGACVRNQLLIWEGLLEMRIHLQRCINSANKMPFADTYTELRENKNFTEECNTTINSITSVLDKLLTLQNMQFKKFSETKSLSTITPDSGLTQQKIIDEGSDEEIPSDTDNEEIPSDSEEEVEAAAKKAKDIIKVKPKKRKLEEYEKEIAVSHKAFKVFRNSTIQKWNEKTRIATAAKIKNAPTNTILQQIDYILSDHNKLIKRTQLKRSEYDIIGYKKTVCEEHKQSSVRQDRKENDEYIPEIFDDSDFYHQLLRELIECKSADISDPVQLSRQWIALQQMRSKMKRKVDTKATKGRKIKYVVHNPLVNFMAPEKSITWNEESIKELYSSLFGKIFEHNNIGLNVNLENI